MRRFLAVVAVSLLAAQVFAASPLRDATTSWVDRAPLSQTLLRSALAQASLAEVAGPRPIVLLETNYYTFLPSEQLQLRVTTDPNGFNAPVTIYLYHENRTTGARQYFSVGGGLLAAGQQSDLFGAVGSPVPVFVPTLRDFVLFGSASDTTAISFGVNGALGAARAAGPIGLYQWVVEIRDAAGKRVLSRSNAMYSNIQGSQTVTGNITSSTTWTANTRYVLNDFVGVVAPATLTIEPGTVIYGGNTRATLFIQRGAKIVADGTARRPIIFTSPQRTGMRSQTDWGSLVLLGAAPINVTGGQAILEGLGTDPAYAYGGTNPSDSSGVLRYVRLEFGGFAIAQGQEINGLTLGGVGSGTVIDYVEVLQNKDDGFEFFGGTVNVKHLLGIGIADDGLDFDFGYIGSVQFAAMIKRHVNAGDEESDSNIFTESDNNGEGTPNSPLTNPRVYNVTAVRVTNPGGNYGGVIRRASAGKYYNNIILNSRRAPITLRDTNTFNNTTSGELVLDNNIFFGDFSDAGFPSSSDRGAQTREFLFTTMKGNRNVDPMLAIGTPTLLETYMPDLTPLAASPALDADFVAVPPDNGFLEPVGFQGAVGPGDNWILSGWANFSDN